jgi:hypothetical protein
LALWIEPPVYDYNAHARIVDGNGDGNALIDRGAIEVDIATSGTTPDPFRPIRVVPNAPDSIGNLQKSQIKHFSISGIVKNSDNRVGWTISPKRTTSKIFSLYYGDLALNNYQTGRGANNGVIEFPEIKFKVGDIPFLYFMLYIDTQKGSDVDVLQVFANGEVVWEKSPENVNMKEWQLVGVNLGAYKGKAVKLAIKFDTINGHFNCTEGVYIDDIMISHNGKVPTKHIAPFINKKVK